MKINQPVKIPPELSKRLPLERLSVIRIIGYAFHATWVLSIFYSVFFYTSTLNFESALYLNQFVSQAALVATTLMFVLFAKLSEKCLTNKLLIYGATLALTIATIMLIFIDTDGKNSALLVIISASFSGVASGVLFVGWMNLFTDGGAKTAMIELTAAYILAALIALVLQYLPHLTSCILTALFACGSGLLLRTASQNRQQCLRPVGNPEQPKGLKWVIYRGLSACLAFGFISGFSDMLSGYSPFDVGENYGIVLMIGIVLMAAIALALAVYKKNHTIVHINRVAFLSVILGCFLLALLSDGLTYQNALIVGGYICFFITAIIVVIDISNYYLIPSIRIVGGALLALFSGELLGYTLGYIAGTYNFVVFPLQTFAFLLCGILLAVNLFLYTEKDMVQYRLGCLFDNDNGTQAEEFENRISQSVDWIDDISERLCKQYKLSARESEVLPLILRGRTIARIQDTLHISAATVHTHIRHIYTKVGVANRQELLDLLEKQN